MSNRLANETSPYLLQHKDNPVDWYPWGEDAFELARSENKPVFLSIGYSACHWCHVMEHESFEDEATAAFMNEHYVNIKVDREERPDVDAIYMSAVQTISGSGGWPMSVFLLPDGRPFYGGTYFPKQARYGMPSFMDLLQRVAQIFEQNREGLERDADNLTQAIGRTIKLEGDQTPRPTLDVLQATFQSIAASYDAKWGGFGSQPKFPPSMTLELLFRLHHRYGWQHALDMATHTLDRMAWGGVFDQIGGGFHRYSVDARWLVPHFEKMLYDNALLIRAYLHGYQITRIDRYRRVAEQIIEYVRREMIDPDGGFYSSQDADSEGHEGKFFIWDEDELSEALQGKVNAEAVLDYWAVLGKPPNFEGHFILWVPEAPAEVAARHGLTENALEAEVETAQRILFERRERRVKPGRDDKILTAWNGLMIKSLAEAGRVLDEPGYLKMASRAADFILRDLRTDGRLLRSYKDGQAKFNAYLEDYAFMAEALLELYESTFEVRWYEAAIGLTGQIIELFWDDEAGFYDTSHDHENLIARPQELTDNALPSGTAGAVATLARMAILAERADWRERVELILARLAPAIQSYPSAFSCLACQLDFVLAAPHEIALVGELGDPGLQALLDVVRQPYRPNQVVAFRRTGDDQSASLIPLLQHRDPVNGHPTAYVCQNYVCHLPVTSPGALREELDRPRVS